MGHSPFSCVDALRIDDQLRTGVLVTSDERLAFSKHLHICSNCQIDTSIRTLLGNDAGDISDELTVHRQIERAIVEVGAMTELHPVSGTHHRVRFSALLRYAISVAAIGVVAIGVLSVRHLFFTPPPTSEPPVTLSERATPDDSAVTVSPEQVSTGKAKPSFDVNRRTIGHPSLALSSGIVIELSSDAKIEVVEKTSRLVRLQMSAGRVTAVVNPDVPHPFFVIDTPWGAVSVKGTVFSVDLRNGKSNVAVLRGVVAVGQQPTHAKVAAGNGYILRSRDAYVLTGEELAELNEIASRIAASKTSQPQTSIGKTERATDTVKTDGISGHVDTLAPLVPEHKEVAYQENPSNLQALMRQARAYKSQRDWANALDMYERIIRDFPDSSDAMSASIAAGNLRLKFGDANGALSHFNQYLAHRGAPLQEEALVGKIKSHRALNDKNNELESMRQFVKRFPDSIHLQSIQKRIVVLELTE